ncbi:MAG: hypothetical protein HY908_10195 [Myxococcales bacterium]|nr:hypothetical protein [Myxococcales bacterium]
MFVYWPLLALPPLLTLVALVATVVLAPAVRRGKYEWTPIALGTVALLVGCMVAIPVPPKALLYPLVNVGVALLTLVAAILLAVARRR